jgi:hypothetical protein
MGPGVGKVGGEANAHPGARVMPINGKLAVSVSVGRSEKIVERLFSTLNFQQQVGPVGWSVNWSCEDNSPQ